MNPQDAVAFLTDCAKWINSSSDDIQGGKELAQEMQAAIKNGTAQEMASRIQEMAKPLESDYLQALANSEVFNGVKDALGTTADVAFSPAALLGVKIAVGALAGGPIGLGIAVAAGVAEISAAAYDINRLNVLHDEACHLKEYAEYKELNQKLIEDITLQCQRNA